MADTRLTKIGLIRCLQLCAFGAFFPQKLIEAERDDEASRKSLPRPPPLGEPRAFKLRRGLWAALVWVLCSVITGYVGGKLLSTVSCVVAINSLVRVLQVIGAMILLWATLFVRGWDIQSFGGVTLTERVNRWIYRLLYCLGTAAIVASLALL